MISGYMQFDVYFGFIYMPKTSPRRNKSETLKLKIVKIIELLGMTFNLQPSNNFNI